MTGGEEAPHRRDHDIFSVKRMISTDVRHTDEQGWKDSLADAAKSEKWFHRFLKHVRRIRKRYQRFLWTSCG
jgi:hypothetical protein